MVPPLFTQAGVLYTYVMGCYLDWRMLALSGVSSRVPLNLRQVSQSLTKTPVVGDLCISRVLTVF